ncbi:hypothetical protein BDZ89DRAFT_1158095 [Hymenopellis radicata]|nr:hypothetical protein BDZ89DRAFT_1158095 [Hymenopellis radicata]
MEVGGKACPALIISAFDHINGHGSSTAPHVKSINLSNGTRAHPNLLVSARPPHPKCMPSPPQYQDLHISFPAWPGWDTPQLSLSRLSAANAVSGYEDGCTCRLSGIPQPPPPGETASSLSVAVDSASHDDYSSDSPVFHAVTSSATSLALKFAFREDLMPALFHEAHMYTTHLRTVQGRAVPWCWGFFVGVSHVTDERIGCLVLEYWGQALPARFCDLEKELRMNILNKLGDIHRCGVHHGDFAERNILYSEGDSRIIDFDQTRAHSCNADCCDLLRNVGREMEVLG